MELLIKIVDKIKGFTNKSGVYCIKSIDNKFYISSAKSLYSRYKSHFNTLKNNKHGNSKLQNYHNKYGKDALEFYVIEECSNEILRVREQYYMDTYKPYFNINKQSDRLDIYNSILNEDMIKDIAVFYNKGYNCSHIARKYNVCTNTISGLVRGASYSEFNYLFNKENKRHSRECIFTEIEINEIAKLYNSGKTCSEISNLLFYGTKMQNIRRLTSGRTYPMYKNLFKYKKYKTPKGFYISKETAKKISDSNKGRVSLQTRGNIPKDIVLKIREDKKELTNNQLSKKYNIPFRTVRSIVERVTYKYY